jgi:Flp pilus assembly pilin Flp
MKNLKNFVEQLHREECGQDIIEYVLIAAFITTAVIATVTAVGKWVFNSWSNLNAQLT